MLRLEGVETCYGDTQVLFGIDLEVREGETVTLMGRNGMGKSTTVASIMGLLRVRAGRILFDSVPIHGRPAYRIARLGIGLVPEGRQVFPNLSVQENLVATAANRSRRPQPWTVERVLSLFPQLAERRRTMAALLSGGEQQMLAIGRALLTNPRLLILDEATEGLAPLVRTEIWSALRGLRESGHAILIIDKNVARLAALADRHYVIEKGRIVWRGDSRALRADPELVHRHLGV